MRRQTKRALYESIMRDVARVVKRRLNEDFKKTRNPNTLDNLTEFLKGNRGIAETFIYDASDYVDCAVRRGELEDIEDDELYDFFWDVVAEADKTDEMIYNMVNLLRELNVQWGPRRDSFGFLAELMAQYYISEYKTEF